MNLNVATYQTEAIEKLTESLTRLWGQGKTQLPIVLKAPTGSGKTFMLAHFIKGLNHTPAWDADKAYVWITFSEELALQSRDKFEQYFGPAQENGLLTVDDLGQGKLAKNDILFLNWQKLVSKSMENRKLRRPEHEALRKEQGTYFDDFIDATHLDGRAIVLIIDEAHTNVTPDLAQEVINYMSPRIVLHVSATPKPEMVAKAADLGSYVSVAREAVVKEGLIKEKIIIQTAEDLERYSDSDFDHTLLDLGLKKREFLKEKYRELGKDINPLLLIQLPNDDSSLVSLGEKTKEQVVVDYLEKVGVDPRRIARWFDNHAKPDFLEENNDKHDVLIFKLAAGTGWDCPRAQVLVMFRNIKVEQRYIQTIGRILRTPDPVNFRDYLPHPELRAGYLYTNYQRQDVIDNWSDQKADGSLSQEVHRRIPDEGIRIASDYLSRIDYGDLSSSSKFQVSFCNSMDRWFGLGEGDLIDARRQKLEGKGLSLDGHVSNKVVVDAEFDDFDQLTLEFKNEGIEIDVEMSGNDVEKTFNLSCWNLLKEQTEDDAKVSNLSRSWSPLKSAFRVWLRNAVGLDSNHYYRVVIADLARGPKSVIRPAVTQALKDYKPILDSIVGERASKARASEVFEFTILESYNFPAHFEEVTVKKSALNALFIPPEDFAGRKNELDFISYLESDSPEIEWWFKQGVGREYFGVFYENKSSGKPAIFYPDWVIKLSDGRVGILDTKMGQTAQDTEGRAEALAERLSQLGKGFFGGIVLKENGVWYLNESKNYSYTQGKLGDDWVLLEGILSKK
jgi:type III restriction enzyme